MSSLRPGALRRSEAFIVISVDSPETSPDGGARDWARPEAAAPPRPPCVMAPLAAPPWAPGRLWFGDAGGEDSSSPAGARDAARDAAEEGSPSGRKTGEAGPPPRPPLLLQLQLLLPPAAAAAVRMPGRSQLPPSFAEGVGGGEAFCCSMWALPSRPRAHEKSASIDALPAPFAHWMREALGTTAARGVAGEMLRKPPPFCPDLASSKTRDPDSPDEREAGAWLVKLLRRRSPAAPSPARRFLFAPNVFILLTATGAPWKSPATTTPYDLRRGGGGQ